MTKLTENTTFNEVLEMVDRLAIKGVRAYLPGLCARCGYKDAWHGPYNDLDGTPKQTHEFISEGTDD